MNIVAIGIGGFFGAILRYTIGNWVPVPSGFPLGTLSINLAGCFFLAWFFTKTAVKWRLKPSLKAAIGTGFTGAFTTFSTFSVETLNLIQHQKLLMAAIYIVCSSIGGIGLAWTGTKLAAPINPEKRGGSL